MKNKIVKFSLIAVLALAASACNFSMSTANISSFKTAKDKEGTQESVAFKGGETMYAKAVVSNAGKVSVKFYLLVDEFPGQKKGDVMPGSEVKVELPSSGTADFHATFPPAWNGKFTIVADLLNESGEKKESKSVNVSVVASAPPAATAQGGEDKPDSKADDKDAAKDGEKGGGK